MAIEDELQISWNKGQRELRTIFFGEERKTEGTELKQTHPSQCITLRELLKPWKQMQQYWQQ